MKNSIKLSALFFLLSTGIFAATSANAKDHPIKTKDVITFGALQKDRGVSVNILKANGGKSYVMVYDQDKNMLLKDFLPKGTVVNKGYVLTDLDNGDYTIEVTSNNEVVKKVVHVYDEDRRKTFFFVN
ncbi:hypothetical protein [Mucilaginibacter sp. SP1R1]|uniref:hypothetical protein n=1 Tax=Mucilaginibacter sp. SP1R1 TaxID=2723091 RepID=UPI00160B9EE9|nr:hypothetical protein [Mucilaginibacter sp. SP1R1]MBB6147555.1 hypothetical protein [Mucilaginibacter sp. SP1R1]